MLNLRDLLENVEGAMDGSIEDVHEVLEEVRDYLLSQQPRVMTLEEVRKLQSLRDGAVWLEVGAGAGFMPAFPEMIMTNITFFVAIPLMNYHWYCENDSYGKIWRCWTARPTDEQRKGAKWDDED